MLSTEGDTVSTGTADQDAYFHLMINGGLGANGNRYRNWDGPYLANTLVDPWANPYYILTEGFCPTPGGNTPNRTVWVVSGGRNQSVTTDIADVNNVDGDDVGILIYRNIDGSCE